MKIDLTDTTSSKINKALVQGRRAIGTPAVGMVLTLVIVTDEENAYDALKAANEASREHPSRTLVVIKRRRPLARATARRPASTPRCGSARTRAPARRSCCGCTARWSDHAAVGGPAAAAAGRARSSSGGRWTRPLDPAKDPLGALAQRRITDAYAAEAPVEELDARADAYTPGRHRPGLDPASRRGARCWPRPWTRPRCQVTSAAVEGEAVQPELPSCSPCGSRTGSTCRRAGRHRGPRSDGASGCSTDGRRRSSSTARTARWPRCPSRASPTAQSRSSAASTSELIAEELRRLDPDEMYAVALSATAEDVKIGA